MRKGIIVLVVVFALILIGIAGHTLYENWKISLTKILPRAPTNLIAKQVSATQVKMAWKDNSNNENGFLIYRDGEIIEELPENHTEYVDKGRRPATNYCYEIQAYNQAGKSDVIACSIKTLNPPIVIWIDKIGVHENGEEGELIRELGRGEVYAGVIVTDNKTAIKTSLPNKGHYSLNRDEVTFVGVKVFDTNEVGEYLRLAVVSYEDDGGFGEQVIFKALDMATKSYIGGPTSILLTLASVDFTEIFADIFGAEDDWLGTYVSEWTSTNNWGVGNYIDVKCKKADGDVGLRLWFRVECPVYDYASERAASK